MLFDFLDKYINMYGMPEDYHEGFVPLQSQNYVKYWLNDNGEIDPIVKGKEDKGSELIVLPIPAGRTGTSRSCNVGFENIKRLKTSKTRKETDENGKEVTREVFQYYSDWVQFSLNFFSQVDSDASRAFQKMLKRNVLFDALQSSKDGWLIFVYHGKDGKPYELVRDPAFVEKWSQEYRSFLWGGDYTELPYYDFIKQENEAKSKSPAKARKNTTSEDSGSDDSEEGSGFKKLSLVLGQGFIPCSFNHPIFMPWNIGKSDMFERVRENYPKYLWLFPYLYNNGNIKTYKTAYNDNTRIVFFSERKEVTDFFSMLFSDEEIQSTESEESAEAKDVFSCMKALGHVDVEKMMDNSSKLYFIKWGNDQTRYIEYGSGEVALKDVITRYRNYMNSIGQVRYSFKDKKFQRYWPKFYSLMCLFDTAGDSNRHEEYQKIFFDDFLNHIIFGQPLPRKLYNELQNRITLRSIGGLKYAYERNNYNSYSYLMNARSLMNLFRKESTNKDERAVEALGRVNGITKHLYDRVRSGYVLINPNTRQYNDILKKLKFAIEEQTRIYGKFAYTGKYTENRINAVNLIESTKVLEKKVLTPREQELYIYGSIQGMIDMEEYGPRKMLEKAQQKGTET
jgi:hypothetical protein